MRINSINNTNFRGLWFKESATESRGKRTTEQYVYRPFIDEDINKAEKEVEKFDGKFISQFYLFNHENDEIIDIQAKLGAPLNIREEEYARIRGPLDVKYPAEEQRVLLEA